MTDYLKQAREVFGVRGELCKHISASEYAIHKILSHLEEKEKAGGARRSIPTCVECGGPIGDQSGHCVTCKLYYDDAYARGVKEERERIEARIAAGLAVFLSDEE